MATFWDYNARALNPQTTLIFVAAMFDVSGDAHIVAGDTTQVTSIEHNSHGEYTVNLAQNVPEIVAVGVTVLNMGGSAYVDSAATITDIGSGSFKVYTAEASTAAAADMPNGSGLGFMVVIKNSSV